MEKVRSSKINVSWNDMGIFMILALLIVILSVIRPVFLTPDNIINVIRQVTIVAIIGIGMSFVLISGEIDLSVGSICALSGIIVTMCLRDGFGMTVSILLALCCLLYTSIPKGSRASREVTGIRGNYLTEEKLAGIRELDCIAKERNQTLAQMALAWILRRPEVTSVLIGASSCGQLEDNVAALKNTVFGQEELARIEQVLAGIGRNS